MKKARLKTCQHFTEHYNINRNDFLHIMLIGDDGRFHRYELGGGLHFSIIILPLPGGKREREKQNFLLEGANCFLSSFISNV